MTRANRAAELVELVRALGHESALVGGLAVSARSRERFTRDMDFAVAVETDDQSEKLAMEMQQKGFELKAVIEQEAVGVIATLRFRDPREPSEEPSVDLICGSCGIEREIVADASEVALVSKVVLPVASLPHLVAMKVLSEDDVRTQDRSDLQALLRVASSDELVEAHKLVKLIATRGFNRDRDLESRLNRFVEQFR